MLGGRVITELGGLGSSLGQKQKGYVFAGAELLAEQQDNLVKWQHTNPITGSQGYTIAQGIYYQKAEFDAMGVDVGFEDPYINCCGGGPPDHQLMPMLIGGIPDGRCQLDGMAIDCGWAMEMLSNGSAAQCPNNDCGPRWNQNLNNRQGGFDFFRAYADGFSGFVPMDGRYMGHGLVWSASAGRGSLDELASIVSLSRNHHSDLPLNFSAFPVNSARNSPSDFL